MQLKQEVIFNINIEYTLNRFEVEDFSIVDFDSYYTYLEVNLKEVESQSLYTLRFEMNNLFKDNCFDRKLDFDYNTVISTTVDNINVELDENELRDICQALVGFIYVSEIKQSCR